jgi:iron complex outermembrane receptor protein
MKSTFYSMLAAGTALTACPQIALAEDASAPADGEIVVSGLKRQYFGDTPVKELPQAAQFLESKLLDDLNITRLDMALDLASGVSKQNNFGGLWDSFAIRGFAGDENFPSGFLVNGFNGGRGYGGPRDASNVERIEILKGPNSALFGRGEPGGTVNIVTKKPQLGEVFGGFGISGGSWNKYHFDGDINVPLSDSFAVRLNGTVEDADSFRDTVHTSKYVITPSLLAKFSDQTLFTYEMEYVNQKVPFDRGVLAIPTVNANSTISYKLGAIPNSRFLGNPADGPMKVTVLGHQLQFQHEVNDNWTLLLGAGFKDTTFEGFSSDPELVLGRQLIDNDGQTLSRQRRYRDYSTTHMVFRGEISGKLETGSVTHNIRIGGDWDRFKIELLQLRYRPSASDQSYAINIFNPNYSIPAPVPTAVLQNSTEVQRAWGIYAQDQMEITDRFKVRFGGRYDHFTQEIDNRANGTKPRKSYTKFSPMAGLVFEPSNSVSLYASYGKGFRPNSGVGFDGLPFAPETSESYEIGIKYMTPDGKITSTLSLYTMKKNNVLTTDPVNAGFSKPVGAAKSKGFEFDINAKLPAGFQVFVTYAYTDASWDTNALDPNFAQPIRIGDPLVNIPKHQANALLFKNFSIGNHEAMLGAGVNYVDRRLGETATRFFLPSYTIAKVVGSFNITEKIKISANVDNIFDKKYYASSYAALWVAPGTPRSFSIRADVNF